MAFARPTTKTSNIDLSFKLTVINGDLVVGYPRFIEIRYVLDVETFDHSCGLTESEAEMLPLHQRHWSNSSST